MDGQTIEAICANQIASMSRPSRNCGPSDAGGRHGGAGSRRLDSTGIKPGCLPAIDIGIATHISNHLARSI
jgi:hypothetical protein